jgi:bifunctional non-homologous end joining protein LigD
MSDLSEYRRKRDPRRTPEPVPARRRKTRSPTSAEDLPRGDLPSGDLPCGDLPSGDDDVFVIQEHHARRLHWDVRFERDGVLVSWAVPKGLPPRPGTRRLAVHTEDHPLEYASFEGEIPSGEYGGGTMKLWDRGRYETLHWNDHKVEVSMRGSRVRGTYVFVNRQSDRQDNRDWFVQRVGEGTGEDLPGFVPPMLARRGALPAADEDAEWAYEFAWGGERVQARVEGGRVTLLDAEGEDVTAAYPELKGLGAQLGATEVSLDGEMIVLEGGKPAEEALRRRAEVTDAREAKRLADRFPVVYLPFDVLHLSGKSCLDTPYRTRRRRLERLGLAGDAWRVPRHYVGGGADVLEAALTNGLTGITAKRLDSRYEPGRRSASWRAITRKRR